MKYIDSKNLKNYIRAIDELISLAVTNLIFTGIALYLGSVVAAILGASTGIILLLHSVKIMVAEKIKEFYFSTIFLILVYSISIVSSICVLGIYADNFIVQLFSTSLIFLFLGLAIFAKISIGKKIIQL